MGAETPTAIEGQSSCGQSARQARLRRSMRSSHHATQGYQSQRQQLQQHQHFQQHGHYPQEGHGAVQVQQFQNAAPTGYENMPQNYGPTGRISGEDELDRLYKKSCAAQNNYSGSASANYGASNSYSSPVRSSRPIQQRGAPLSIRITPIRRNSARHGQVQSPTSDSLTYEARRYGASIQADAEQQAVSSSAMPSQLRLLKKKMSLSSRSSSNSSSRTSSPHAQANCASGKFEGRTKADNAFLSMLRSDDSERQGAGGIMILQRVQGSLR